MEPLNPLLSRRRFLGRSLAGCAWMTSVGQYLAEANTPAQAPRSIIMLWLQGGPSQLETFDPQPGKDIAYGTEAIATTVKSVQLAAGLERTAEEMESIALIRSMVSKEGDHERATYTMKTGFRPDPTVVHPSIGAILCHETPRGTTDIPRHISILPDQWSARGGYLGDEYDAFRTGDPAQPVPDIVSSLPGSEQERMGRDEQRLRSLDVIEKAFARGRERRVEATLHRDTVTRARSMMSSEQLRAFDVAREPLAVRRDYGDTAFGRACLAARRLTEVGVRCVEVTLGGWDTHTNNHRLHKPLVGTLDPALAALIRDLRTRGQLDHTLVICGGEFGRTPKMNAAGGRDHWPTGFSIALAGCGIRGGTVVGITDPEGHEPMPTNPVAVGDLYATLLTAVGIEHGKIMQTKIGRTVPFSEGKPVKALLS